MKIAIVTPWYTNSIGGGAERFAGGIAKSLQDAGCDVEILTTCGKDSFHDWGTNYYKEGLSDVHGLTVRRFPLRQRQKSLYDDILGKVIHKHKISYVEELQLFHETVNSDALIEYIIENGEDYVFLFIPYLFGTTFWGSKIRPENSFVIPCLHDEEMAYFRSVGDMLNRSKGVFFNTIEEQQLTKTIHPSFDLNKSIVSGGGVEIEYVPDSQSFKQKHAIHDDYILYVGRQVGGKNVPQLIEYFNDYIKRKPQQTKLVFIGSAEPGIIEMMKESKNIIPLGELSDQEKYDAISGAVALIQPSLMESFSIVIMESWLCNTPVIVHGLGVVTKGHCERSEGGWHYKDADSFESVIEFVLAHEEERKIKAANGKAYVEENYTWAVTARKILSLLQKSGFERSQLVRENSN
ncbi:glycosyltransferase family 4 protein [Paenibacillus humicus]|uniref:glycosyltransferase family 4 protein n=1 Tax=Paenibacillus humicus TaxID=412861 RepID=UPI003F13CFF8